MGEYLKSFPGCRTNTRQKYVSSAYLEANKATDGSAIRHNWHSKLRRYHNLLATSSQCHNEQIRSLYWRIEIRFSYDLEGITARAKFYSPFAVLYSTIMLHRYLKPSNPLRTERGKHCLLSKLPRRTLS